MCNSTDERTPLVLEADNTSKNHHANSAIISMVEHYRQSELYRVTERQIKTIFDQHQQKVNSGNEEINEPPNYATNIFWQVNMCGTLLSYVCYASLENC